MLNLIFNLQQKRTWTCLPSRKSTNLLYQRTNVQEQVSQPKALQQSAAVKLLRRPIHCPPPPNIASGRFCFRKRTKFFRNSVFFTPNHSWKRTHASVLFFKLAVQFLFHAVRSKHASNTCASKFSTSTDSGIVF